MGPDIRWVGTETGYGRETEWSVVPVTIRDTAGSASLDDLFLPGDMTAPDLGSRAKIREAKALAWYPAETNVSIRPGWFYHAKEDGEVKSPETLLDIHFSSVGRNSVLLLNVPPDRRGRIHENDAASLLGFRRLLDGIFKTNLAAGAGVRASSEAGGHPASAILDGVALSFWRAREGAESATVEFDLGQEHAFDVVMLQENIRLGQRVEEFSLQAWDGKEWVTFAGGTTIGYKRLLRFAETSARKVRLIISKSRTEPTLAGFGLFRSRS